MFHSLDPSRDQQVKSVEKQQKETSVVQVWKCVVAS
jgi:hypothetical protein